MNVIRKMFSSLFTKEISTKIGRWNIERCNKRMDRKIDLSNEDHCGPCGQYALKKLTQSLEPPKQVLKQLT